MTDAAPRSAWEQLQQDLEAVAPERALALHSRAARLVAQMLSSDDRPPDLTPLRIAVLRSFTAETLAPSLVAELARAGLLAQVELGQLGNIAMEALSETSFVHAGQFDAALIFALAEHIVPDVLDPSQAPDLAAGRQFIEQVEALAERFEGFLVVANFAPPPACVAPHLLAHTPDSGRYALERLNHELAQLAARRPNVVLLDVAGLAAELGHARFWSLRDYATSLQPFTPAALAHLARRVATLCTLYKRTAVKCIVLDCDNTLWGGVIGEEGLSGIALGETYPGWCYLQFQQQLAALNRIGFLLALNSKNNEDDVRQVFAEHHSMVLRMEHIAAMRVNWVDKVSNMRALAQELNIGLDSFVFIDDSDFELNFVREQLPQVQTLRVPERPWELPRLLAQHGLIDRLAVTSEDRGKAAMYRAERERRQYQADAGSIETYLRGLNIQLTFEPFDPQRHLTRAAQLTQKTNQFNLTTRRCAEADIRNWHEQAVPIYLASLTDRFGEYGRIALAIVHPAEQDGHCRLTVFLMSCRAIGRGVEESFLRLVMTRLKQQGYRVLNAEFIPTKKNAVSADFLSRAGLRELGRDETGRVRYEYDLTAEIPGPEDWLTVTEE